MPGDFSTLVFCTSHVADARQWAGRYRRWLDHHRALAWDKPLFCFIDDGSPFQPAGEVTLATADAPPPESISLPLFFRFDHNLGRVALYDYPGWWRSFLHSVVIARHYGCRKIVHIESDAFVLSRKMMHFIDSRQSGWTAFWCPKWNFPETGIQVICEDQFGALERMRCEGWLHRASQLAEHVLPFTGVVTSLHGNRYAEFREDVPAYADYAAQVTPQQIVRFRN